MTSKLNVPQEIEPGSHYSFRTDLKVNGWSWVAVLTSFASEVFLLPYYKDWPVAVRTIVAFVPLLAGLLWVRSILRWLDGMDEMQRRITQAASMFATVATLFIVAASHLLVVAGVLPVRLQATAGFEIIWLVVCFYILGQKIFNRRYQ